MWDIQVPVDVLQPGGVGVQAGQLVHPHGVVQLGGIPTLLPEQKSQFYKMFTDGLAELSLHSKERRDCYTVICSFVAIIQLGAVLGNNVVVYRETQYRIYRYSAYKRDSRDTSM